MTRALLCPGPDFEALLGLAMFVAAPVAALVVGKVIGEVIKALRRTRLR